MVAATGPRPAVTRATATGFGREKNHTAASTATTSAAMKAMRFIATTGSGESAGSLTDFESIRAGSDCQERAGSDYQERVLPVSRCTKFESA